MNTEIPAHTGIPSNTGGTPGPQSMPDETAGTAPQPSGTPAPAAPAGGPERPRPRTGPIVWGAIVLAVCAYVAIQLIAPGSVDATAFVIASVIGLGVLLLVVGVAVLVRNNRNG